MTALSLIPRRKFQESVVSHGLTHDTAKDQVRQAVDIVDLVGDYLQLRREGRGYKALCPWHDDSRPSLQVNPERQSFRCWVCDIGGDAFSFIMKMEGVTFPEALAMLADRAGIQISSRGGSGQGPDADAKRLLYQAMAWAEQQYHDCLLKAPEAQKARDYLHERGLTDDTIHRFHLGYSPERWDWLVERAGDTRFTPKVLETVGLVSQSTKGRGYYDRFRGRVLFSIRDPQGRPVGMGGRIMPGAPDAENTAKYVNSPETPLFSKSHLLYGLDAAKDALAKTRTAVVVEGYTDSLLAQQFGFGNVLAVLGTALGERHLKLLRRFVDRIVLVLDGDEAGKRRTDQILELFVAEQMDLQIVTPPDELDPADFLLAHGATAFAKLLDSGVDALEHKFRTVLGDLTADSGVHAVMRAVESVLTTLARSPRLQAETTGAIRLREDQILHRLAQRSGLEEVRLRQRLTEMRRSTGRQSAVPSNSPNITSHTEPEVPRMTLAERWLLQLLIVRPEFLAEMRQTVEVDQFRCQRRQAIYAQACRLQDAGHEPSFERLMLELDDPNLKSLLVELDEERHAMARANPEKELRDLLKVFRELRIEQSTERRSIGIAPPLSSNVDDGKVLSELVDKLRSRQGISRPTDG